MSHKWPYLSLKAKDVATPSVCVVITLTPSGLMLNMTLGASDLPMLILQTKNEYYYA